MSTIYFVSRHPGAQDWTQAEGVKVDRVVKHLDAGQVESGDVVIGTLPVNVAAAVCAQGARYFHLSLTLPENMRGQELTTAQMRRYGAKLVEYWVEKR